MVLGVKYPLDSDFKRLEHLTIPCSLPVSNPEHIIRIELTDKVTLEVNVNAWIDIQMQFLNYKNLFRGSLYKLEPKKPGLLENGFFFLPEEVMKAGKEYDWDKHAKEVGELLRQRETSLIEMEQKGHFYKKQEMRH